MMLPKFSMGFLYAAALLPLLMSSPAQAQEWPVRTVKFIVPLGAGAGADIGGRLIAERVQKKWGKAVIIENRPGGDSLPALTAFATANDDHTLFFAPSGSFAVHPHRYAKLPYDPVRDLLPIARVSETIIAVASARSIGANNLKEVVDYMRANPGKVDYAVVPGTAELVTDGFFQAQKLQLVKVPYRDIVQGVNDLAVGRLQFMMASLAIFQPALQNNSITLLALTNRQRADVAPGIATVEELGFAGLELEGLVGLFGPPTLSLELRRRIGADVVEAARDPEVGRRLAATAQVVNPGGADEFQASLNRQKDMIAANAKATGLEPK